LKVPKNLRGQNIFQNEPKQEFKQMIEKNSTIGPAASPPDLMTAAELDKKMKPL